MFPAMDIDGNEYYLKPMNCPHHHKIYASLPRTYKELPIRYSEYGTCYRYDKTGQLFGLMRVRSMQMNDAHIYCSEDQFKEEFLAVCKMYLKYFEIFGIEKYEMRLSLHSKDKFGKKYVNEPELWVKTENLVRQALENKIFLTTYGRSSGFCIDPIEKKPLNHFLPGTPILSFGTAGCNLTCKFCQNWDISKSREFDKLSEKASPEMIADAANLAGT